MKVKVLVTIFLVALVVANYLLINRNKQLAVDLQSQKVSANKVIEEKRNVAYRLQKSFELTNINYDKILSESIFSDTTVYIYYSEMHCFECLQHILNTFHEEDVSKKMNTIVLAHFASSRSFEILTEANNPHGFNFINCFDWDVPDAFLKMEMPVIFTLDKNYRTNNVFVPEKTMPVLTEKYCRELLKKVLHNYPTSEVLYPMWSTIGENSDMKSIKTS